MNRPLAGRIILVIEDEPLIALDIQQAFEEAGARIILARTVTAALVAIQQPDLSAAIVDHALGDGDSSDLCERLKQLNVPFVMYSGFADLAGECADAASVTKPERPAVLVATIQSLLASRPISN